MPVATSGSSLRGNVASTSSSLGGNVAKSGSSIRTNTARPRAAVSRGGGLTREIRSITRTAPTGSLLSLVNPDGTADDLYDHSALVDNLSTQYATLVEQKMYAQLLRTLVARENKEFQDWAKSKRITLNTPSSLLDFVETLDTGEFTSDTQLNGKIKKVLDFIPDIVGAVAKNEAIAPGAKILKGENPVIDETVYAIEKVIAPTMKKVGGLLEKRFGSEIGGRIGKSLISWGERLATLPTQVLSTIGPADVVASVVDAGLLAIDRATGNYRQVNHDLPDEVLSIPVIGSTLSILSSVRDLIDSAVGIPRDDQAIPEMYNKLVTNLWGPAKAQYDALLREIAKTEPQFERLAKEAEVQSLNNVVYTSLVPAIGAIARRRGNDRDAILRDVNREFGVTNDSPKEVRATISDIVDAELGRMTPQQLQQKLQRQDISKEVPTITPVINGLDVKGRVALDNVYSADTALRNLQSSIPTLEKQANDARAEQIRIQGRRIIKTARGSIRRPLTSKERKRLRELESRETSLRSQLKDIQDVKLPKFIKKLQDINKEFDDTLQLMESSGLDTSFMKKSANWDKMLADAEDDTMFWSSLPGFGGFGSFGGGF